MWFSAFVKDAEVSLRARDVSRAALFGSVARGESDTTSDIDIMVEFGPEVVRTIYDYVGLRRYIADVVGGPLDVVARRAVKPHVRTSAPIDVIDAF